MPVLPQAVSVWALDLMTVKLCCPRVLAVLIRVRSLTVLPALLAVLNFAKQTTLTALTGPQRDHADSSAAAVVPVTTISEGPNPVFTRSRAIVLYPSPLSNAGPWAVSPSVSGL